MPDPRHDPTDVEPDDAAEPAQPDQVAPRDRLVAVFTRRPGRGQLVVAALLALLGFAAAVQIRQTDNDGSFGGQSRQNLVVLIDSLSSATDRANSQLDDLEQTRDGLLTSSQRRQAALQESRDQLDVLNILTGSVPATGPGITIVVRNVEGDEVAPALLNGIEELRVAGAEAIEINDSVRVVASTSFTQKDGLVYVDGAALRAPYVIDAIGEPGTLSEAMVFRGGFVNSIEARLGGTATIERAAVVLVSSLHQVKPDEYAHPTDR